MSYILPGKGDVHRCVASNPYTVQKFLQNANFFVKKFSKVKHGSHAYVIVKLCLHV